MERARRFPCRRACALPAILTPRRTLVRVASARATAAAARADGSSVRLARSSAAAAATFMGAEAAPRPIVSSPSRGVPTTSHCPVARAACRPKGCCGAPPSIAEGAAMRRSSRRSSPISLARRRVARSNSRCRASRAARLSAARAANAAASAAAAPSTPTVIGAALVTSTSAQRSRGGGGAAAAGAPPGACRRTA